MSTSLLLQLATSLIERHPAANTHTAAGLGPCNDLKPDHRLLLHKLELSLGTEFKARRAAFARLVWPQELAVGAVGASSALLSMAIRANSMIPVEVVVQCCINAGSSHCNSTGASNKESSGSCCIAAQV